MDLSLAVLREMPRRIARATRACTILPQGATGRGLSQISGVDGSLGMAADFVVRLNAADRRLSVLPHGAACRDPVRPKNEGNRGVSGIEIPGFEPNVGPVRQKMREKVHSPYLATSVPITKIGQEPK
jgi:hypothetical protein